MKSALLLISKATPWLRQTSTITGISTLVGLLVAWLTGEATWQVALPVGTGALVAMLLPGHPEASGIVTRVTVDALEIADPKSRAEGLHALTRDLPEAVKATLGSTGSAP